MYLDMGTYQKPSNAWESASQMQKLQSYTKQDHEGKTTQQWHNYAYPRCLSARQQQISQLAMIIDISLKFYRLS